MKQGLSYGPETVQVMKELRANGWSLEGIAWVYDITVPSLRLLIREEDPDNPCPFHPERGWGHGY